MTGIAPSIASLFPGGLPLRLSAYDGSEAGPADSQYGIEITSPRALSYILTAPGDLGLGRAYVAGDLVLHGAHPGNPYEPFRLLKGHTDFGIPSPKQVAALVKALGLGNLVPPAPPPEEHLPAWRVAGSALRGVGIPDCIGDGRRQAGLALGVRATGRDPVAEG